MQGIQNLKHKVAIETTKDKAPQQQQQQQNSTCKEFKT